MAVTIPRLIVLLICLALTIVGVIIVEPSTGTEYSFTCAVLSVFFLIIRAWFGWPVHVMSVAFTLALTGAYCATADTVSQHRAGYALIVIGMWASWLAVFDDTFDKLKAAVPSQLFAPVINLVAFIAVCVNFLGCILLWAVSNKGGVALGVTGWLSSILFIAAWWLKGAPSTWIGFFWFASFQHAALASAIACGKGKNSDSDLCTAGSVFLWMAHVTFLFVMFWVAKGTEFMAMLQSIPSKIKSVPFIVLLACLLLTIIGAAVADAGWDGANAVAVSLFLIAAFLLNGSGEKEVASFFCALSLILVLSGDFIAAADADRRNKANNDSTAAGCIMMVIGMWCGLVAAAWDTAQSSAAQVAGLVHTGATGIVAIIIGIAYWVGLALVWYWIDNKSLGFGGFLISLSITCMLIFFMFIVAVGVKRGGVYAMISEFFVAIIQVRVLDIALAVRRNSPKADGDDILVAGHVLIWICQVVFIALCVLLIGADPQAGTGGASAGAQSGGSMPPQQQHQSASQPAAQPAADGQPR